jgi:hypothetical protein
VLIVFSLHQELLKLILVGEPSPQGGSVTAGVRARLVLNKHSRHLKFAKTFTVSMLNPYKNYSSLLSWQANMCSYIATMELHQ